MSGITPGQLLAFCHSIYEVKRGLGWEVLDAAPPAESGVPEDSTQRWALISACNPLSALLHADVNRARHDRLHTVISAAGATCFPGRGRAPDSSWSEDSWLVHAPLPLVDAWATAFDQHAVYLPPQQGQAAGLRIYSPPADGQRPPFMGNLRLEWVGCDPPFAT
ncbi:MAG: DUF3293 domain-containing protein [Rhodanobacteraceae bacterium]|nr:DUF3293 domain-containing protein [Rhodanobacteraceae bacterium]